MDLKRVLVGLTGFVSLTALAAGDLATKQHFVQIAAKDRVARSRIVNLGVSIESIVSDSVYVLATDAQMDRIRASGLEVLETFVVEEPSSARDFPDADARFHNYKEMTKALDDIVAANPRVARKFSIGKTLQGRDIWAVEVRSGSSATSMRPGIVFMGNHHAREHVSAEIPLMLLEFLVKYYGNDPQITKLIDGRDIFFIPMVNPDGVEYDIAGGRYKYQRKNMRENGTKKPGVDLNRNYEYMWGTGGSSKDPSDETFMGPAPFSEPETQAVRDFIESHQNLTMLLSFHTFSELILYPWGYTYDKVENSDDHSIYKTMAEKMAGWNHYTPQQSSDLYISSGDTTDWAYGRRHIYSFTFELSPKEMWDGGFYPGAGVLDRVFEANIKPALYMIELANNPKRVLSPFDPDLMWLE